MILVLVEHDGATVDRASLEALAVGRAMAEAAGRPLAAMAIGATAGSLAAEVGAHGASTLLVVDDARLEAFSGAGWGAALAGAASAAGTTAVVAAGTDRGNEVLAHAAARLDAPFAANCVEARPGPPLTVTRQRWGGSLLEDAEIRGPVAVLSVAPHAVAPADPGAAEPAVVEAFAPELASADLLAAVTGHVPPREGVSLADARVVVGGGRGMGSAEAFAEIEELAALLGGAVGVSRAVTSAGWRPHAEQVGQTGTRIAPELYIACGISGAIQHMVGARTARRILAINTDRDAPMVEKATYAVIGDLHSIVPAISAEIRRVAGRG